MLDREQSVGSMNKKVWAKFKNMVGSHQTSTDETFCNENNSVAIFLRYIFSSIKVDVMASQEVKITFLVTEITF